MNPFARWFGRGAPLTPELKQLIADWQATPSPPPTARFAATRAVVVDTETGGLDTHGDRLLAVGAVGLDRLRIHLADSFDTVLRQARASARENIVVHGIGAAAQIGGEEPQLALLRFLEFCGKSTLIAFHAPIDEAFVKRGVLEALGVRLRLPWIDLAVVLPALYDAPPTLTLDDWLQRFEIAAPTRHSALGDAFATAQLAQIALRRAQARGIEDFGSLARLERDARWLRDSSSRPA